MRFFFKGSSQQRQEDTFNNTTLNESDISEDTLNKVFTKYFSFSF